MEKCWSNRGFLFAVNEALYIKEITVQKQKQKLIILEIRQTKSLTDGLPHDKTDGLPDNKTVDKWQDSCCHWIQSVIQFDEGVQFPLSDKHAHWCV